ncbi:hypothetical protein [Brachybacterium sp.]|uniref:hypothetical protein n=1 Tax=Brachybacterium sp. TaxID=1891286 RepID=UPI002ED2831E
MAPNMGRGITAPANDENIKTGAAEMQVLGSTTAAAISDLEAATGAELAGKASTGYVDAGLAGATSYTSTVESSSLARDDALAADIAGMEGMTYVGSWQSGVVYRVNDVVTHGGDSWARLTAGSTGEPGADPAAWGLVARKGDGGGFGELSETDVPGLYAPVQSAGPTYDSGPRRFTPTGGIIDPANTGSIILQRLGRAVYCRIDGLLVVPGALDAWLWPNGIPAGFTIGEFGLVVDVTGGYTGQAGMNGAVRHRLTVYQNDLRYVGYLHGATATTVEPSRADQTRRIYGWLPSWITDDREPA